jgi:hypothetical protein
MRLPCRLFLLCCLCCGLAACSYRGSAAENQIDKATGHLITQAIEHYYADHGSFPRQLLVLVPRYLSTLPQTTHNRDFAFRSFSDSDRGDDYELCFYDGPKRRSSDYGCCYIHSFDNPPHFDGWDCTAGHP